MTDPVDHAYSFCEMIRLGVAGGYAFLIPALRADKTTALVRGYEYDAPHGAFGFAQARNLVTKSRWRNHLNHLPADVGAGS